MCHPMSKLWYRSEMWPECGPFLTNSKTYKTVKPGIQLNASPGWVAQSRLGALVWMALQAEENRVGLPLDPIHRLSVHQSEPPPSHSLFAFSVEDLCSSSLYYLALTSQAESTQAGFACIGLGSHLDVFPAL